MTQYHDSPHASSESGGVGNSSIAAADDRLIASAFATLNSTVLTPPGTSSGIAYAGAGQDPLRYSQVPSQGHSQAAPQSSSVAGSGVPTRRHTVSHSYSGLGDMSFLPGWHPANETSETGLMHPSSEVSAFGGGMMPGISEPAQSGSLVNSPDSSLHGYQYLQDPRHVPTSMPFRRSCQDLADWPTLPDQQTSSATASNTTAYATGGPISNTASHESSRKAWREYESLCQALFQSVCTGPDPDSFEQRTISFWNSLSATARESWHKDASLQGMMLKADDIIFQQLLIQLDAMIGDDVSERKLQGLKKLKSMLSDRMASLVGEALPEACKAAKVQASQKMAESVKQVVEIFEAVKAFREDSMLDVATDDPSRSLSPHPGQPSAPSTLRSAQTTPPASLSSATGASTVSSLSSVCAVRRWLAVFGRPAAGGQRRRLLSARFLSPTFDFVGETTSSAASTQIRSPLGAQAECTAIAVHRPRSKATFPPAPSKRCQTIFTRLWQRRHRGRELLRMEVAVSVSPLAVWRSLCRRTRWLKLRLGLRRRAAPPSYQRGHVGLVCTID